jgi:tetratricopeptide (TPR) repeat protein
MQGFAQPFFNMARRLSFVLICIIAGAGLAGGCKKASSNGPKSSGGYFEPQFQTESQFVVDAIVSDLAEQMYFAMFHRLPDKKYFSIVVTDNGGSIDEPIYSLQIRLDRKISDLKMDVKIDGPIWSPDVYRPVAENLARAIGLNVDASGKTDDTSLLSKLLDATPETLEQQNQELSNALESDFQNPTLHEKAALLMGAFVFREHSGSFFEIRSPLSRITAHLVMARFLRGSDSFSIDGQMAETLMLTTIGDEAPALERLRNMDTNDPTVNAMVRGVYARNTGDYQPLTAVTDRSPFESIQLFYAMAATIGTPLAWPKLADEQRKSIDYVRLAYELGYSVEIGHELLENSGPLEMREIKSIYELSHHNQAMPSDIGKILNELPEYCFSVDTGGKAHVHILGWGQWAMFFQRHLCNTVAQNFYLMNSMWGVPDDAKEYAARCDQSFGNLTLYPFVRRFDCTDVGSYHKAVDDGLKMTVSQPQFVPAECWNYLCYTVPFAPLYNPNPNPHVNEWHDHNPPPGTVYDLNPRLDHPSLVGRPDALERFDRLRDLAPYDLRISRFIMKKRYQDNPDFDQAMALYHDTLSYSPEAMQAVANSVYGDPAKYVPMMTRAAEINPRYYYFLGDYVFRLKGEDKAASYYQKGFDADPDRVGASDYAEWLVRYWHKHQQDARADAIAQEAGMVYSFRGLRAQAVFLELTSNYDGAFEWFAKIEERYNDPTPVMDFCFRYKAKTGDSRFEAEVQKRTGKLFPRGLEKVTLADFKSPPTDGVTFRQENELMKANGLTGNDIIVAVYGIRVHNATQYMYARTLKETPEMDLIVWQGNAYREIAANPPRHLFGVDIDTYSQK